MVFFRTFGWHGDNRRNKISRHHQETSQQKVQRIDYLLLYFVLHLCVFRYDIVFNDDDDVTEGSRDLTQYCLTEHIEEIVNTDSVM